MITTEELSRFPDTFNGDDAHLVRCIEALLSLDATGTLVPHGIGGHARGLLSAAMHRLAIQSRAAGGQVAGEINPLIKELADSAKALGHWSTLRSTDQATIDYWADRVADLSSRLATPQPPTRQTCAYCAVAIDGDPPKDAGAVPAAVQELRALYKHHVNTLESARDQIIAHGGECDAVDVMERRCPVLKRVRDVLESASIPQRPPAEPAARAQVGEQSMLSEYVADYEYRGEDGEGRDACYTPNERERLLIEDAILGWDEYRKDAAHPPPAHAGTHVCEVVFDPRPADVHPDAWVEHAVRWVDYSALPVGAKIYLGPMPAHAGAGAEAVSDQDCVAIANAEQAETWRSIYPNTVRAVIEAARRLAGGKA